MKIRNFHESFLLMFQKLWNKKDLPVGPGDLRVELRRYEPNVLPLQQLVWL